MIYTNENWKPPVTCCEPNKVKEAPQAEPTVGTAGMCLKDSIECSVCGYLSCKHDHPARKNYCPNCGADMRGEPMDDLISRQVAIDVIDAVFPVEYAQGIACGAALAKTCVEQLPSAHPETCEGCKHLGKWENEVEYGYPSPCTGCKRRVKDHYER